MRLKKFMILVVCLLIVILSGIGYFYTSAVNFIGEIVPGGNETKVVFEVITPLGQKVLSGNSYSGYCKDITVFSDSIPDKLIMRYKNNQYTLQLVPSGKGCYKVIHANLNLFKKAGAVIYYSWKQLLWWTKSNAAQCSLITMLLIILALIIYSRKKIKIQTFLFLDRMLTFVKKQKYRIIFPVIISFVPGLLFAVSCSGILNFLQLTIWEISLAGAVIFFIPFFLLFFYRQLKINPFFWLSFILVFVTLYTLVLPDMYLYGQFFRDDISKYFVKAYSSGFFQAISTPDSNYLAVFQSVSSYLILHIFSIRYFPEALQLFTLVCILLISSTINLKTFQPIMPGQWSRFVTSLFIPIILVYFCDGLFFYSIPFLVALLLFYYLFVIHKDFSLIKAFFIALFFGLFILSKPYFVLFVPFLLLILIQAFTKKQWTTVALITFLGICILVQIVVSMQGNFPDSNMPHSELGTHYDNSFRTGNESIFNSLIMAVYLFFRLIPSVFFPLSFPSFGINLVINIISASLILFTFLHSVITYFKTKSVNSLLAVGSIIMCYFTLVLFVKTGIDDYFLISGKNITKARFGELAGLPYMLPHHRYLILAYLPMIGVVILYAAKIIGKIRIRPVIWIISSIFILIGLYSINGYIAQKSIPDTTHSLWRQYGKLIWEHPDLYYLPYYGYPKTSECIKYGCDKIIDVNVPDNGIINIDNLLFNTEKWQIIQLITEYDQVNAATITNAVCLTNSGDTLKMLPEFPVNPDYRFIVFRFNSFCNIKQITFMNKEATVLLKKPVRLIGLYE